MSKKILFVTTRSPFSNIFSGDRLRAKLIIKNLRKKYKVDVIYSDDNNFLKKSTDNIFFRRNLFDKIKGIFNSFLNFHPLQLGYFYSDNLNNFIKNNHNNYGTIIFHLIRSAQYLHNEFKGKKILEMTDLLSKNYGQITKTLSLINPLFYMYSLEKILIKKYEKKCFKIFHKIVFVSKNDFKNIKYFKKDKLFISIQNSFEPKKNIFKYKNSNYKIVFIGNINYLPNKKACLNFSKKILPHINNLYKNKIEFHIVGEINIINKIIFNKIKNTYCHGPVRNLEKVIKNSICGICNLDIATGLQNKILTYSSYGLPCVSSKLSQKNTFLLKNKEILVYSNNNHLIKLICKLKENKIFSNKISRNSYTAIKKKYNAKEIFKNYNKII